MRASAVVMLLLVARGGAAAEPPKATFALVVGVNRSVDPDERPLRYADDDAAQYQELFRTLGARTYLLTRADDNTQRLHPQASAEARAPREREWKDTIGELRGDIERAHAQGIASVLYFVYAGHGNVVDGRGYVALEDGRLTGERIRKELVEAVHADETHLVVDACYSYFVAFGRGPTSGTRREIHGFGQLGGTMPDGVGLLLSTSSARESHEWEGFQAGVFSHEVRSGLYGAADLDGDGRVSYREIAAFVERANVSIANERYRPDVFARPPRGQAQLIDLHPTDHRRAELAPTDSGHFIIEDDRGVRVAELNKAAGRDLTLVLPPVGALYLRRDSDDAEFRIGPSVTVVRLPDLTAEPARLASRGAAHEAFSRIFSVPFDHEAVEQYRFRSPGELVEPAPPRYPLARKRRLRLGGGLLGSGLVLGIGGLTLSLLALDVRNGILPGTPQTQVVSRNDLIQRENIAGGVLYGVAAACAIASVVVFTWDAVKARSQH